MNLLYLLLIIYIRLKNESLEQYNACKQEANEELKTLEVFSATNPSFTCEDNSDNNGICATEVFDPCEENSADATLEVCGEGDTGNEGVVCSDGDTGNESVVCNEGGAMECELCCEGVSEKAHSFEGAHGLMHYRKWWEKRVVEIFTNGERIVGTPIFSEADTLRVVNETHSYFIQLDKIDYIRTNDGLNFPALNQ